MRNENPPYHPPEHTMQLPEETIQLWKKYLNEQDRLKKERDHKKMIERLSADPNYEKYRAHVLKDGRKDTDFGFESLFLLHKHFEETPQEELDKEFEEIDKMDIQGPTVDEYFESLNPSAMYAKGYSEGATKFKDLLIAKLKENFDNGMGKMIPVITVPSSNLIEWIENVYNEN